ncbi:MAG: acyl-CoA dehydrogenase [Gammaproteobacteria bacterium]
MWPCLWTVLIGISILLISGYCRLSRWIWLPLMGVWLWASIYLQTINTTIAWILGIILVSLAVFIYVSPLRRDLISTHVFKYFKKLLPPISRTEQEALDAGNLGWETDLMRGKPDWHKLHAILPKELTLEEQNFLNHQVETLCKMLNDWEVFRKQDLPQEVWDYMRKERFWGLIIPKEYGGLEFSNTAHSQIVMKIATRCGTAGVTVMVPNSLGPGELIVKYGTQEQKDRYLARLAVGEEIPCFGLTEPMAGSDAGAMEAVGVVCRGMHEGQEVLGIRLNWQKRYITLAPIATIIGIAFKLMDPDALLGTVKDLGITLCLVPAKHPGVEVGDRHMPLTMGFMNGPIRGRDVFIPLDWIIGGKEQIGQGWRMLMQCLSTGRGISLPATALANDKVCFRLTGAYAAMRQQFNLSIGRFPGVQEALGRLGGLTYLSEATRLLTLASLDHGYHSAVAAAITKYYLTEFSRTVIDDAMDIHGGRGIILGPRNYLANAYLNNPVGITVEGANILTRNLMIFGQGAIRCHPYVLGELNAAANPDAKQGLAAFDKLIVEHMGYVVSNFVRLRVSEVKSWWCRHFHRKNIESLYYSQLERMSNELAVMTDLMFILLGGDLKRQERISGRLADVLGYLYMSSAVLRYFSIHKKAEEEIPYVKWCLDTALYVMQQALVEIAYNFPQKGFKQFLIRRICFPFTLPYRPATDADAAEIATSMQETSVLRDRITQHMFLSKTADDVTGRVEDAFKRYLKVQHLLKKFHAAIRGGAISDELPIVEQLHLALQQHLLNKDEIEQLQAYYAAYFDMIAVDAFPAQEVGS